MSYTPPDKIEIYAAALLSDINSERFQQVVNSKLDNVLDRHRLWRRGRHGARLQVRHARGSMGERIFFCGALRRDCERAPQGAAMSRRAPQPDFDDDTTATEARP